MRIRHDIRRSLVRAFISLSLLTPLMLQANAAEPLSEASLSEVKGILRSHCADCHGSEASSTDFDVLDAASLIKAEVVKPGNPEESKLIQVLITDDEEVRMPQDLPALSVEDVETLRRWISAGAQALPSDVQPPEETSRENTFANVVGVEYVLKQILAHQQTLESKNAKFYRYFSCNHLLTRGTTRDELKLQKEALVKTLNHLTYERELVPVETIDGETGTVFSVDIRRLGWHLPALKATDDFVTGHAAITTYDLILLEYPYSIRYEDSATYDRLVTDFMKPSGMIREIPWLRTDWF